MSRQLCGLPLRTALLLCIGYGIAALVLNVVPLLVGSLMSDFQVDEAQAGLFVSTELIAMALVAISLSRFVDRLPMVRVPLLGTVLLLLGHLLALYVDNFHLLLAVRIVAGLGEGLLLGSVMYFIAVSADPVRLFGLASLAGILVGAVYLVLLPAVIEPWGYRGALAAMAVSTTLFLILIWHMSIPEKAEEAGMVQGHHAGWIAMLFALAVFIVQLTQGGYYAFVEQIGSQLEMKAAAIGIALSISYLVALLGSGVASLISERFGIFVPLVLGMIGHAAGVWFVVYAPAAPAYVSGVQLQAFFFFLFLPYMLGLAARIDPSGRLSTLVGGLLMLGLGAGPLLTGLMVVTWGYESIAVSVVASVVIGFGLMWYAAHHASGRRPVAQSN